MVRVMVRVRGLGLGLGIMVRVSVPQNHRSPVSGEGGPSSYSRTRILSALGFGLEVSG